MVKSQKRCALFHGVRIVITVIVIINVGIAQITPSDLLNLRQMKMAVLIATNGRKFKGKGCGGIGNL